VGGPGRAPVATAALPAEVLLALEPRARSTSRRDVWARRMLSLGALGILVALFTGTCMKS
jgi:hypothetical protein